MEVLGTQLLSITSDNASNNDTRTPFEESGPGPGKTLIKQSFRTPVGFLGISMLLRQSNRLSLKLADFFTMLLPKEGQ
jgi:hypothetical protein